MDEGEAEWESHIIITFPFYLTRQGRIRTRSDWSIKKILHVWKEVGMTSTRSQWTNSYLLKGIPFSFSRSLMSSQICLLECVSINRTYRNKIKLLKQNTPLTLGVVDSPSSFCLDPTFVFFSDSGRKQTNIHDVCVIRGYPPSCHRSMILCK